MPESPRPGQGPTGATPDPPAPPWRAPRAGRAASRAPLSRETIVDAALAVLDQRGAEGLSMRHVAAALGTAPASLYWHVRNKDELLQLISERLVADVDLPPPDPGRWRDQVKDMARQVRSGARQRRDAARITLGRVPWGPALVRVNEWLFELLGAVGIPDRVIAQAADLAALYVAAFAFEESLGLASPTGERQSPQEIVAMFRAYLESLPEEQFPHVHRAVDQILAGSSDERFEFGLEVIVRGIASYARDPGAER